MEKTEQKWLKEIRDNTKQLERIAKRLDAISRQLDRLDRKTEPHIVGKHADVITIDESRLTAKCLNCANGGSYKCSKCDGEMYFKDMYLKGEPQLTPNYCGTCKHREVPCGDLPCDACHGYSNYEPKDEPQTERSE